MLAKRLSMLRNKKKKTQQQLADFLGITRPAYTAYELGSRQPDYDTLKKLADFFEVSTDYLLGHSDLANPSDETTDLDALVDDPDLGLWFRELNEHSREEAKRFIKFLMEEEKNRKPGDKQGE